MHGHNGQQLQSVECRNAVVVLMFVTTLVMVTCVPSDINENNMPGEGLMSSLDLWRSYKLWELDSYSLYLPNLFSVHHNSIMLVLMNLFVISLQICPVTNESHYEVDSPASYCMPGLKEEEIYSQMSQWKYREIPHNLITLSNQLGVGQFGEVYQAEWEIPQQGVVDVAVKLVKNGAPREERLKLLQEAAILGQFRHKHVVSLLGVVTLREPVSGFRTDKFKHFVQVVQQSTYFQPATFCVTRPVDVLLQAGFYLGCIFGGDDVYGKNVKARVVWGHDPQKNLDFRPI